MRMQYWHENNMKVSTLFQFLTYKNKNRTYATINKVVKLGKRKKGFVQLSRLTLLPINWSNMQCIHKFHVCTRLCISQY